MADTAIIIDNDLRTQRVSYKVFDPKGHQIDEMPRVFLKASLASRLWEIAAKLDAAGARMEISR